MPADQRSRAKRVKDILGEPDLFPDEFRAWVPREIERNPGFILQPSQLPSVEGIHYVGGDGNAAFSGSWVNYGSGYEEAGYYKDPFGRVYLSGLVKFGAVGSIIFNLPPNYRPKAREVFVGYGDGALAQRVDVAANGDVIHIAGATGYISLSNINFRAFA